MKKLLAPLTLIALAGILFSSCSNSSKLSFTKRHYRGGYFVDRVGKTNTLPGVASIPAKSKQQVAPSVIAKSENPAIVNTPITTAQNEQISKNKIVTSVPSDKNTTIANSGATNNLNEGPVLENKENIAASPGDGGGSAAGAALSLLWIVIVIILAIWLIAILVGGFGLGGGLINLLLLIALILLILWLLRVW
jgi:hypothetical protein